MPLLNNNYLPQWGWAVLDSLWQFGILYLLYIIIRQALGKRLKPAPAFRLLLLLVCAGTALFLINMMQPLLGAGYNPVLTRLAVPAAYTPWLQTLLLYTGFAYIVFSAIRLLLFARRLLRPQAGGAETHDTGADFMQYLHDLCAHLRIRVPAIRFTRQAVSPFVTGLLRHVIIIPASLVNQLSPQEMEAVILHELAHIKRGDMLTNLLVLAAEQLLWFNPFAKELLRQLKEQREMACDDAVIQMGVIPMHYASSLHKVAVFQNQTAAWQLPMSVGRGQLMQRVQRLFKNQQPVKSRINKKPFFSLLLPVFALLLAGNPGSENFTNALPALNTMTAASLPFAERRLPVINNQPAPFTPARKPVVNGRKAVAENRDKFEIAATSLAPAAALPAPETESVLVEVAVKTAPLPYTTFVSEGSHRSKDVVMRFTDSALVYENFISRQNMESSTAAHLAAILNIIAAMPVEAVEEPIRFSGLPASISVLQDGAPNLYFHDARLRHEAVYDPVSKEWSIHLTLLNGGETMGERYVTIFRKQTLRKARL